jgi:hypothetical protein
VAGFLTRTGPALVGLLLGRFRLQKGSGWVRSCRSDTLATRSGSSRHWCVGRRGRPGRYPRPPSRLLSSRGRPWRSDHLDCAPIMAAALTVRVVTAADPGLVYVRDPWVLGAVTALGVAQTVRRPTRWYLPDARLQALAHPRRIAQRPDRRRTRPPPMTYGMGRPAPPTHGLCAAPPHGPRDKTRCWTATSPFGATGAANRVTSMGRRSVQGRWRLGIV